MIPVRSAKGVLRTASSVLSQQPSVRSVLQDLKYSTMAVLQMLPFVLTSFTPKLLHLDVVKSVIYPVASAAQILILVVLLVRHHTIWKVHFVFRIVCQDSTRTILPKLAILVPQHVEPEEFASVEE